MGNYFMMSMKSNPNLRADYGLAPSEEPDVFIRLSDHTKWKARDLYDYGRGLEEGYHKIPMPSFPELIDIILYSDDDEDKKGAAAVVLGDFAEKLLDKCFEIFAEEKELLRYYDFFGILQLQNPINRSPTIGKHFSDISKDFKKWEEIAKKVSEVLEESKSP